MFQYQALGGNPNLMRDGQDKIVTKKNYPQYFKLVLCSKDRDVGSTKSYAKFSDVKLPESFSAPAVLIVESFNLRIVKANGAELNCLEVHMPELLQTRYWSSRTGNLTDVICVTDDSGYFNNGSCSVNSIGVPIHDQNFFRNNSIIIYLSTLDNESGNRRSDEDVFPDDASLGELILTVWIVCLDDSVPM
jgi:hypothetical protein